MAFRIVKFSGRPQENGEDDRNKDDREDEADARRKTKGGRERKVVSVNGRLLRPCSRSFPLNSSAGGSGERSTHGERGRRGRGVRENGVAG